MRRAAIWTATVASALLGGCLGPDGHEDPQDTIVRGHVLDDMQAPVPGAYVEILRSNATTDANGTFSVVIDHRDVPGTAHWNASAPGHIGANGTVALPVGVLVLNITLERALPLPAVEPAPSIRIERWNGTITCDAVVVVGHDHGSGAPDPGEHTDCDPSEPHPRQSFPRPEGTGGLVALVAWEPQTQLASHLTTILTDADGEPLAWSEGVSPLRLQVPREGIPPDVVLHVLAGADDGDAAAGVAWQQPFSAELHWFLGQDVPADYDA